MTVEGLGFRRVQGLGLYAFRPEVGSFGAVPHEFKS